MLELQMHAKIQRYICKTYIQHNQLFRGDRSLVFIFIIQKNLIVLFYLLNFLVSLTEYNIAVDFIKLWENPTVFQYIRCLNERMRQPPNQLFEGRFYGLRGVGSLNVQLQNLDYMSSIIDDLIFYRPKSWSAQCPKSWYSHQTLEEFSKNFSANQGAILLNGSNHCYQTFNKLKLNSHEYSVRVRGEVSHGAVRVQARLLQQSLFKRVQSRHNEILLLKQAARRQFQTNTQSPFCTSRGCLVMVQKIYFYVLERVNGKKIVEFYNCLFNKNIRQFEDFINKQIHYLGKTATNESQKCTELQQDLHLTQILCASSINFDVSQDTSQFGQFEEATRRQRQEMKLIVKGVISVSSVQKTIGGLYQRVAPRLESNRIKDNLDSDYERNERRFGGLLAVSKYSGEKRIDDFIFNMVKVNLKEVMNKPFSEGGSCQLYIAKAEISYINSIDNTSYFKNEDKKEKIIALKKLKPEFEKKFKNKLDHQKNIVSKLKGGCSYFIPKYFRVQPDLERADTLLMQYIQGDELDYFVMSRQQTISLWTKACVLLNIVHGIRHLISYQIVHLDLKPINIMVCRQNYLITKIIDYGEAYHREVCDENYSPGYTFPYVAPEVFVRFDKQAERKEDFVFSEKQDVFAFGFLMFEMIFSAKTFQFTPQRYKQIYTRKEILSRLFLAYERLESYGDNVTIPALTYIIIRCLDPDPARRPRFDWIGIALKLILNSCAGSS